jgi:hypothetical protein
VGPVFVCLPHEVCLRSAKYGAQLRRPELSDARHHGRHQSGSCVALHAA